MCGQPLLSFTFSIQVVAVRCGQEVKRKRVKYNYDSEIGDQSSVHVCAALALQDFFIWK